MKFKLLLCTRLFGLTTILLSIVLLATSSAHVDAQETAQATRLNADQAAVGTAFTYQGRLTENGVPASGNYDFVFALYDSTSGGSQVGTTQSFDNIDVQGGLFAVQLDFGSAFNGEPRYLEIGVRPGVSTDTYTPLTPRRLITPSPYAVYASQSSTLSARDGSPTSAAYADNEGMLHITDGQAGQGRVHWDNSANNSWGEINRWTNRFEILASDQIEFAIGNVGTTKMIISNNGNVGIGTRSPVAKLDVAGNLNFSGQKICSVYIPGNWRDTVTVPAQFTENSCNQFKSDEGAEIYVLGCIFENGIMFGIPNGGKPSPNCGW